MSFEEYIDKLTKHLTDEDYGKEKKILLELRQLVPSHLPPNTKVCCSNNANSDAEVDVIFWFDGLVIGMILILKNW